MAASRQNLRINHIDFSGIDGEVPVVFRLYGIWSECERGDEALTKLIDERRINDWITSEGRLKLSAKNIADHSDFGHI
ncbi:hypothetical protein IV54_GL000589 [Levilactobacillus paucivorans]|uniref:Uncharacterized protein n=1 Tax=Levilactobacillus paucivorans TaxID=616990 RepID=A0A0R2LPJ7_9LACO|nr:hypothetical protein IV54_GL000589 [Levilactobacillus paucivorans]